jgi:hypothetical protein
MNFFYMIKYLWILWIITKKGLQNEHDTQKKGWTKDDLKKTLIYIFNLGKPT